MFEKVNPSHPDKVADRISGAIVDLCYTKSVNPKVACDVVLDEMNLDSRTFATFMARAQMLGARVEWHNMKKSCEECKRRNAQAGHPVDEMEIERLAHEFGVWLEH